MTGTTFLPCPFCGGQDTISVYAVDDEGYEMDHEAFMDNEGQDNDGGAYDISYDEWREMWASSWDVVCACGASVAKYRKDDAVKAWNARVLI